MPVRKRIWVWFVPVLLLLVPLAGCSGGDSPDDDRVAQAVETKEAVAGSFVGEVSGTRAFVAVAAAPAASQDDPRAVQVYVSDGRRLSEWFSGSISDNRFVATSDDGSTEAKGTLSGNSVTGTVELPGGKTARYEAATPSGAAGLYELTVSAKGNLRGVSAAGLGVTGEVELRRRGSGLLELADGGRLEFDVVRSPTGKPIGLRAGQLRLIVLPSGELKGAGKSRPAADGSFFIRSSA